MARTAAGLKENLKRIPELRQEFATNVIVPGSGDGARTRRWSRPAASADFLEFAELLCQDALDRDESCGGHFREEHQYPDGEAKRDDEHFQYVSAWEFAGVGTAGEAAQRAAGVRRSEAVGAELQVTTMHLYPPHLAATTGASSGGMVDYEIDVTPDTSFLEMLDLLNESLIKRGEDPIAFDSDCREGICGTCSLVINGLAHGPVKGCATCQLAHAIVQGRRPHLDRAVAGRAVSGPQGPCRRSQRL